MEFYERPDVKQAVSKMANKPKRELAKLPEYLAEGELVEYLCWGQLDGHGGLFVISDRRVLFIDEGRFRSRSEDFPFDRITTVGIKNGMMGTDIELASSGHKQKMWVPEKALAKEMADHIRERISRGSRLVSNQLSTGPGASPVAAAAAPAVPSTAVFEQLKQLAELRDLGLLTTEEFEDKRRRLIQSI